MKIILSQEEVLDIVLAWVKTRTIDAYNDVVLDTHCDDYFVTVSYVEPTFEEPTDEA